MPLLVRSVCLAALIAMPAMATPQSSAPAIARPAVASDLAGTWTGAFARTDWTFELTNQDGKWAGRYTTAKIDTWSALENVNVAGASVSFTIKSQPVLTFDLNADQDGRTLSGAIRIPNGMSVPFTATRGQ